MRYIISVLLLLAIGPAESKALLIGGPDIIDPPASVRDNGAVNVIQQGFNERQDVLLEEDLDVDEAPGLCCGAPIPAGETVNSHMIFLNIDGNETIQDLGAEWSFDSQILGVMSDTDAILEIASTPILGAPGTEYPQATHFSNRGLEIGQDTYRVDGHTLVVDTIVTQPGDWIRVVTLSCAANPDVCNCSSGIRLKSRSVSPGENLEYKVRLNHRRPTTVHTAFTVTVYDPNDQIVTSIVTPEYTMNPGDKVVFLRQAKIPLDADPGVYRIDVGIGQMKQGFVSTSARFHVGR